ncbi:hypothetical protein AKO1_004595 [Acrasis kona]|uniref:RGS domain-containing protein n=1 Tax=Acrasis kona TaxID=1008807 RepID=A0AAW2YHE5_9EUKA
MSWLNNSDDNILNNRLVVFDRVFTNNILADHFLKYLKLSFNEEGYLFLLEQRKFVSEDDETRSKHSQDILNTFISIGSPKELNIDGITRKNVSRRIEECRADNYPIPKDVFDELTQIITRETRDDSFARYQRSETFLELVRNHGASLINDICANDENTCRDTLLFSSDNFSQDTVTDYDIKLLLRLSEDSADWKALRVSKKNEVERESFSYISKRTFTTSDGIKIKLAKFTGVIPFSAEQTFHALVNRDLQKYWDSKQVKNEPFCYSKAGDYSVTVQDYVMNIVPHLMKKRQATKMSSAVYDTKRKCYLYACKTTDAYEKQIDPKNACIRFYFGVMLYRISETKCRYVYTLYYQFTSNIKSDKVRNAIFNLAMKQKSKAFHSGIVKACQKQRDVGFKRPENNTILDTFDDFSTKYLDSPNSVKTWDILDM